MDEDKIVHEIMKSLAFEIEAVNQDNVLKWSTTNGTPLNVKVRVRNKDEPRLVQRGVVPVPRIAITAPEKLRLISSDQTILSFNVYMEDDLAKQEDTKRRNGLKLFSIGGCLGTYSDDEGPYLPGSSKQNHSGSKNSSKSDSGILNEKVAQIMGASNTLSQKQMGFFGKCKRGGCLDPPFGEDKYPYGLPKTNRQDKLELEIHELEENKQYTPGGCLDPAFSEDKSPYTLKIPINEEKLELSELEDNLAHTVSIANIDSSKKINKESSEHRTSDQKTKSGVDPKRLMDIYSRTSKENSLASKYSNSLITYPTDISSNETVYDQIPHKRKSVRSYDEETQRTSYDQPQSYFVPPKNILRYKEEERRYSRELSDDQIRKSTKNTISEPTDTSNLNKKENLEYNSVSENSNGPRDEDEVKLALTKPQPSGIKAIQNLSEQKQNDNATFKHLEPIFLETASYVQSDTTKMDDIKKIPVSTLKSISFNESYVESLPMETDDSRLPSTRYHGLAHDFKSPQEREKINAIQIDHKNNTLEYHPNALYTIDCFHQDYSNRHEIDQATIDLYNQSQADVNTIQTADTETLNHEPQRTTETPQIEMLDKRYSSDEIKVTKNNSLTYIPSQKDFLNSDSSNVVTKQNLEEAVQSVTLSKKNDITDSQPISKIKHPIEPEVAATISPTLHITKAMTDELSLNVKDQVNFLKNNEAKDNIGTHNEMCTELQSEAVNIKENIQKEHGNLSHNHILNIENTAFDISSTNSMDSKHEHSLKDYTNTDADSLSHREQGVSIVNLNAANEDGVILQKDLVQDINIKTTTDSTHKIMNAILQKTPFITRHDSDIHNDEVNKTIPLKRNTFTIIGSGTSLLKEEEDEEITENIPDVYLKSTDMAKLEPSNHAYNKLHVSDEHNEIPNTHILTLSDVTTSLNNSQDSKCDVHLQILNKPISFDEYRNNTETSDETRKREENKVTTDIYTEQTLENISTSSYKAEVLVDRLTENGIYLEGFSSHKSINVENLSSPNLDDSESVFNALKPAETIFMNVNNQKSEAKVYKYAPVDSSQTSITGNVKGLPINMTDECKLDIRDNHEDTQAPLYSTNNEIVNIMAKSNSSLAELLPVTKNNINSKINDDCNIVSLSPTMHQKARSAYTSQNPISENIWDKDSEIAEDDNSTQTFDEIENSGTVKELGKTMRKDSSAATIEKHKPEYLRDFDLRINPKDNTHASDTKSKDLEYNVHSSHVSLTQKSMNEIFYLEMTNKSLLITQEREEGNYPFVTDKELENIMSKETDTADYTTISQKPITDTKITDYGKIVSVDPISNKTGLLGSYDNLDTDTSQKRLRENVSDLYPELKDDENSTQKHSKSELDELEGIIYTDVNIDTTQKVVTQKENDLYFKNTDDNKDASPASTGIDEQNIGHQQTENQVYSNLNVHTAQSLTSFNGQILDPVTTRKFNESGEDPEFFVHKDFEDSLIAKTAIDSSHKVILDNVRDSHTAIDDDGKTYDGTGFLNEDSNQPQTEISKDFKLNLFQASGNIDTISNASKLEKTSLDIGARDSYTTKYQKSTTVEPSFYTDTKTNDAANQKDFQSIIQDSMYDSTEFKEKGSIIGEVLSNISEHFDVEDKMPVRYVGHKDSIEKDVLIPQFYTETNKVYETLDSKPADIAKDSVSTTTTIAIGNSNLSPKVFESKYNVPRNTLVSTSISTLKLGTDEDKNKKAITEALESMKYISHSFDQRTLENLMDTTTSNMGSSGAPLEDDHREYQWPQIQNKIVINSVELVKDNLGKKSPSYDKAHSVTTKRYDSLTTQKEVTVPVPSQQVMLETENLTQTGVPTAGIIRTESVSLERGKNSLYLDMSFYSYINENNERIIQTHDPLIEKQRHDDGTVTVLKTLIRHGNQIRIPVDKDNDLALNILDKVDTCNKDAVIGSTASHVRREHDIDRTSKRKAVLNKNLALIYESELIPLHNAIKDLAQEVNLLTVKREMLQEKKRNVNRTKSVRLIPVKRCGCRRM